MNAYPFIGRVCQSMIRIAVTVALLALGGGILLKRITPPLFYVEKTTAQKEAEFNRHPDLVFSKDFQGYTPLHWAAYKADKELVKFLISRRADVNATNKDGSTPLHFAAQENRWSEEDRDDVTALLLASKAKVNAKDKLGMTPLQWAVYNDDKGVVDLLLAYRADINATNNFGQTPLHTAVVKRYSDVAELLRQHGGHE